MILPLLDRLLLVLNEIENTLSGSEGNVLVAAEIDAIVARWVGEQCADGCTSHECCDATALESLVWAFVRASAADTSA